MPQVHTYPEMNRKVVGILRVSDSPVMLYAAQRIEELEKALNDSLETLDEIKGQWGEEYLWGKWRLTEDIELIRTVLIGERQQGSPVK